MSVDPPPAFGALLRHYRRAAQLSQEALAERAGLSARTISDLERGEKQAPHHDTVRLLAAALALSAEERAALEAAIPRRRRLPMDSAYSAQDGARSRPLALPLVGRDAELALLHRHLAGDGPPLLALAGEPGIGKSRVLAEAGRQAAGAGWTVLAGGCQRRGGQEPYAPLLQALANHLHGHSPAHLRTSLRGCAWLVRLLPELAAGPIEPVPAWTVPPEQERRLLFAAVARYLANVAGPRGTLLLLDDLQWAGRDALDLLFTLVGASASAAPLCVIGAYRDTDVRAPDPLVVTLADLAAAGRASQHPLGPLAPAEAAQLLDTLLPAGAPLERGLRERVVQRTGGVPFFLVSYAQRLQARLREGDADDAEVEVAAPREAEEAAPWDVAQGIRQRVAALPEDTQQVLSMAAVVGRRVPYALLSQVTARAEDVVLLALERARQAGLLAEQDHAAYQFAHDLIREVLEDDLGAPRRTMLHRRVAEALEQASGEPPVEELAYHYGRSAEPDKAARYLEQAGDHAWSQYASAAAEGYYRQLVGVLDTQGRTQEAAYAREKLGTALEALTQDDAALTVFIEAEAAHRQAGNLEAAGWVASRIGLMNSFAQQGSAADGLAYLEAVLPQVEPFGASPSLAGLYTGLAWFYWVTGRYQEQLAACEQAVALARTLNDGRLLAGAEQMRGLALLMVGQLTEALAVSEHAIALCADAGDLYAHNRALHIASVVFTHRGEFDRARQPLVHALAISQRLGATAWNAFVMSAYGQVLFFAGEWDAAGAALEQSVTLARGLGGARWHAYSLLELGRVRLAQGAWEDARRHLDESVASAEQSEAINAQRFAHSVRAEWDIMQGQPAAARDRLIPLIDGWPRASWGINILAPVLAWAYVDLDDLAAADAVLGWSTALARDRDDRLILVALLRVRALLALRHEHWAEAAHALAEGLAMARSMRFPYAEARLLHVSGQWHAAQGEAEAAHRQWEAAEALLRQLGAHPEAEAAARALATLPRL